MIVLVLKIGTEWCTLCYTKREINCFSKVEVDGPPKNGLFNSEISHMSLRTSSQSMGGGVPKKSVFSGVKEYTLNF